MTDLADIAARVALELGLPSDDERVTAAVDAAVTLATTDTYGTGPAPAGSSQLPLDDPAVAAGLVKLGVVVFVGPRGPTGDVESDVYGGAMIPTDPMTGVRGYFDHLRTAAAHGIA